MDNKPLGADQDPRAPYNEKESEPEQIGDCVVCDGEIYEDDDYYEIGNELVCDWCAGQIADMYNVKNKRP